MMDSVAVERITSGCGKPVWEVPDGTADGEYYLGCSSEVIAAVKEGVIASIRFVDRAAIVEQQTASMALEALRILEETQDLPNPPLSERGFGT